METQQIFGKRLEQLLLEKGISQAEFAESVKCSRQSINFYILGKRNPDIVLAARMANQLGVSCDYLVGLSNIREDKTAKLTADQLGLSDDTTNFFAGLKLLSNGEFDHAEKDVEFIYYNMQQANITLDLLNKMITHDRFGLLLQYIKRYKDISNGEDPMAILQDFMLQLESPLTGKIYGTKEENMDMMKQFCLHVASKYLEEIIKDIVKE